MDNYFGEIEGVVTERAYDIFAEVLSRTYDIPPHEKPSYFRRMELALMWQDIETLAILEPSGEEAPLQAPGSDVKRGKPRLSKRKAMRRRRILGYAVALTSLLTASVAVTAALNVPSVQGALYGTGGFLLAGGGLLLAGWIEGGAA